MTDRDPLAESLAALSPAPPALNRDLLNFEAGRAAGARPWRFATGAGLCASVAFAIFALVQPPVVVVEKQVVEVTPPAPPVPAPSPELPDDSLRWVKLRNAVLEDGVDELPPARPGDWKPQFERRFPLHD